MRFTSCPRRKPSGVEWLGEIPHHWEAKRLKYVASLNDDALPETTPPDRELHYVDISSVDALSGVTGSEQMLFENAPSRARRLVKDGDTIVSTVRTYLRAIASVVDPPADLVVSTGFAVVRPRRVDARFLSYALRESHFVESIVARSVGVSYPAVNASEVGMVALPLPPSAEQRAIATFLDRETARLDALVAKKQELIGKLKAKRIALIARTAARGLDLTVPMRDSGVQWLGRVPVHWRVKRLKYLVRSITDTEHKTAPFYPDGEYLVARTSNVRDGCLVLDDAKFTDREGYEGWTRRAIPEPGDILLTREAPAGEACLVPHDQLLCLGQRMVLIKVKRSELLSRYGLYALCGGTTAAYIASSSQGSTVDHLNMSDIPNIPIPVPPLPEQEELVCQLDRALETINATIRVATEGVGRLREYRAALITAAVTGKIDVRGSSQEGNSPC